MIHSDTLVYATEILNFLQSVTIKFEPFALAMNRTLADKGYEIDTDDRTTWKYYQNAVGKYHVTDSPMYVISLDTGEEILFSTDTLNQHPKTRSAYTIGKTEYKELCRTYPSQVDLIKSIIYPVSSIEDMINADDLTMMGYDSSFLEYGERDVLITDYTRFLTFFRERWYIVDLGYEDHYFVALWGCLIYLSIIFLLVARLKYLKTEYAHSFHIWEYLRSKGLSDYRDILDQRKAVFLYKNINYIQENAGKASTLDILIKNILRDLSVGMVGEIVYQSLEGTKDTAVWNPKIHSVAIAQQDVTKFADGDPVPVSDLVDRLYRDGYDNTNSVEHTLEITDDLRYTTFNTYPTKILEIKKYSVDDRYLNLLSRIVMDTLVVRISEGSYIGQLAIQDESTGLPIVLSYKDALALLNYAVIRANNTTLGEEVPDIYPIKLPTKYEVSSLFKQDVDKSKLSKTLGFFGYEYKISEYLNIDQLVDTIPKTNDIFRSPTDLAKFVNKNFVKMMIDINNIRASANLLETKMFNIIYSEIIRYETIDISLSEHTDYGTFVGGLPAAVRELLNNYETSSRKVSLYNHLADTLLNGLLPITSDIFGPYATDIESTGILYKKLKSLFTQLCSYNILFLDTDKRQNLWFLKGKIDLNIRESFTDLFFTENYGSESWVKTKYSTNSEVDLGGWREWDHSDFHSNLFIDRSLERDVLSSVTHVSGININKRTYVVDSKHSDVLFVPRGNSVEITGE